MIVEREGNLFDYVHQAYAHGVSTRGRMGAGIAKTFKEHYPAMFDEYARLCRQRALKPGDVFFYPSVELPSVFNLITQTDLEGASASYLEEAVKTMLGIAYQKDIVDIAMPFIGCGLGGLTEDELLEALEPFGSNFRRHVTLYRASSPPTR